MAWIELHQSCPRHKKTLILAAKLGISRPQAVGHLACLWLWALDNAEDGYLTELPAEAVAFGSEWEGDAQTWVDALRVSGYLDAEGRLDPCPRARTSRRVRDRRRSEWESIAFRVRPAVFERDGYRCRACGSEDHLEVDHIVPLAREGTNRESNLQTLCRRCNRRKGAR